MTVLSSWHSYFRRAGSAHSRAMTGPSGRRSPDHGTLCCWLSGHCSRNPIAADVRPSESGIEGISIAIAYIQMLSFRSVVHAAAVISHSGTVQLAHTSRGSVPENLSPYAVWDCFTSRTLSEVHLGVENRSSVV
jgi:hypothetical protein